MELRCSLGNQEDTYARRLHSFDSFCCDNYPDSDTLTQEISESWCILRNDESTSTQQLRTRILRDFAKYLVSCGKKAYIIPDGFARKRASFIPCLYSDAEIKAFFEAADSIGSHKLSPHREYVILVLFRMFYCLGLRPQEAPAITVDHINLKDGTIHIEKL